MFQRLAGAGFSRRWIMCAILAICGVPRLASGEGGEWFIGADAGVKSGDFGTGVRTSLYSVAPTAGFVTPRSYATLTVPLLSLNQGGVGAGHSMGLGDMVARAGAHLLGNSWQGPSLDGELVVKLPTASASDGLGTGELDAGGFLALSNRWQAVRISLLGGYIKTGDPSGLDYNDVTYYGVGVSGVAGESSLYGSLEGRRALVPGTENPLELHVGLVRPIGTRDWIRISVFKGFNDGGPDFGLSFGVLTWW